MSQKIATSLAEGRLQSQLLLDSSWNFSDKIVVYFKRIPQNERYNLNKYSYQDIEDFVKAKKEEIDYAKNLVSHYNSLKFF